LNPAINFRMSLSSAVDRSALRNGAAKANLHRRQRSRE
jgi:hypothetical protein